MQAGEIVPLGTPLFEVLNDDRLWVRVPVYVGDLRDIDLSEEVSVTTLDGRASAQPLTARPIDYPPTGSPLASAVDLYFEIDNADHRYSPGQRMTVHVGLIQKGNQTVVPWSSIMHDVYGGEWVYEQIEPRVYVRRRVEVSWISDDLAVLKRGPPPGTAVVTAGVAELAGSEFGFAK